MVVEDQRHGLPLLERRPQPVRHGVVTREVLKRYAGGLAFFGYREEFGFYIGSAEPAFRESANEGWLRLAEGQPVKEALHAMTEKFDEWLDYYAKGEGRSDPDAPMIASWLIHDRDCLVALGDMDLKLRDIPAPPEPDAASPWEVLVGFVWSILDAFGL